MKLQTSALPVTRMHTPERRIAGLGEQAALPARQRLVKRLAVLPEPTFLAVLQEMFAV